MKEMSLEEIYKAYETGHEILSGFLIGKEEIGHMCDMIDQAMPENKKMFSRLSNPIYSLFPNAVPVIPEYGKEVDALLHHTAHFYIALAIGLAVVNNLGRAPEEDKPG